MGVTDILPGWPGGDSAKIRTAADGWATLSTDLTSAASAADTAVQAALIGWKGKAATTFGTTWNEFIKTHTEAAADAEKMSNALNSAADKIDELHHKYTEIAIGLGVALAASVAIGIFTFGIGAAAEDAVATSTAIAAVDALLSSLGVEISEAVLADVGGSIADLLANKIVQGMIVGFLSDLDFQEVPGLVAGDGFTPVDTTELAISTAAGGAGSGLIKGALWRRMLLGALLTDTATTGITLEKSGKLPDPKDLLLSSLLGGLGGTMSEANPNEKSALVELENKVKLATLFKNFYDQDPAAAARVAARSANQDVKDAYALLSRYPNLFAAQVDDATSTIGASHTVIAKVFAISGREKVHISYEGLEKAIDKAKETIPEFNEEDTEKQAEKILELMREG